jgi:AcrR family transcriptional regulator
MREPVKGVSEAGRRREARARATRERIVEAARRLFEGDGYAGTTVAAIAAEAGVATATVYQAFGTKQAILARALDLAIANDQEQVQLLDRAWLRLARGTGDPHRRLVLVVSHTSEVAARTAALKRAMRDAAASDPEVRDLMHEDHQRRLRTQSTLVGLLLEAHPLRPGLEPDDAVAAYFGLVNSDCYLLMVDELGWDLARWQRWLVRLLSHELFGSTDGVDEPRG